MTEEQWEGYMQEILPVDAQLVSAAVRAGCLQMGIPFPDGVAAIRIDRAVSPGRAQAINVRLERPVKYVEMTVQVQ